MANIESQGTVFFWSATTAASTAATRTVGQVVGFTGPGGAANVIDVTHLGSTMREKRMGLPDEGTFTMDVLLDMTESSGQQSIRADRATRTMKKAVVMLNDSTVAASQTRISFDAYCTGFSVTGAVDDVVKAAVTLEITGAATYSSTI